jgi:molecular chaperone HtpG
LQQSEVGGGGMPGMGALPENYNLVVNSNHPLTSKILVETDGEKKKSLVKQAADLAMLSQGMLKGEELSNFISRSLDLMD